MPHADGRGPGIAVGPWTAGEIGELHAVPVRNPSWLTASSTHVYAAVEAGGGDPGQVAVLARTPTSLRLEQVVDTGGRETAHLALDATGRFLVAADYGSGSVSVLAVGPDGLLAGLADRAEHEGGSGHEGGGAHPVRQTAPHPHQALVDPVTGDVLVTDLGLDAVLVYDLDGDGRLAERSRIPLPAGSGPRHAAFHPDGRHLLVLTELTSTIAVFRRDAAGWQPRSTTSTLPEGAGESFAGALLVTAAGDRVYATNRGHDSVVEFAWDAGLGRASWVPTRGRTPRGAALSPDDRFLLVANQDSDTVVVLARGPDGLEHVGRREVLSPVCPLFLTP